MKKKGFTLAEALVALGIIGVVAAILMPQLALGIQKKQAGAVLAKAYAQIEQGMQNYVQAYNDTTADGSFVEKWTEIPNYDVKVLMTYSGAKFVEELGSGSDYKVYLKPSRSGWYTTLKGDKYRFNKLPVDFLVKEISNIGKIYKDYETNSYKFRGSHKLIVDVNGVDKKPNAYGNDVFEFLLHYDGHIEPEGKDDWREKCGDTISDGASCTARVMADGWKIKY